MALIVAQSLILLATSPETTSTCKARQGGPRASPTTCCASKRKLRGRSGRLVTGCLTCEAERPSRVFRSGQEIGIHWRSCRTFDCGGMAKSLHRSFLPKDNREYGWFEVIR